MEFLQIGWGCNSVFVDCLMVILDGEETVHVYVHVRACVRACERDFRNI